MSRLGLSDGELQIHARDTLGAELPAREPRPQLRPDVITACCVSWPAALRSARTASGRGLSPIPPDALRADHGAHRLNGCPVKRRLPLSRVDLITGITCGRTQYERGGSR
jgi:hypothetical protein